MSSIVRQKRLHVGIYICIYVYVKGVQSKSPLCTSSFMYLDAQGRCCSMNFPKQKEALLRKAYPHKDWQGAACGS